MKIIINREFTSPLDILLIELFCELKGKHDKLIFATNILGDDHRDNDTVIMDTDSGVQNTENTNSTEEACHLQEIEICVSQDANEQFVIKAEMLDLITYVDKAGLDMRLQEIVAGILGYRPVILSGLCVKDSDGNRIKPLVTLYVYKDFGLTIPSTLEFTKEIKQDDEVDVSMDFQAVTLSPIIKGLLEKTNLNFKSGDTYLTLVEEKKMICAKVTSLSISPVVDALLSYSVMESVKRILSSQNLSYSKELSHILLSDGSESKISSFYKKLPRMLNKVDFKYLTAVVEVFPKLYDFRDDFIRGLQEYLQVCSTKAAPSVSYGYLKVKRARRIRNNIRHSLRNALK
ncbi:hypothetical protein PAEPH01_1640 [Pancytospora epiphaga]|nr:hypothetical protein PAEPH01_1640 [Pancytospora epiphaga]